MKRIKQSLYYVALLSLACIAFKVIAGEVDVLRHYWRLRQQLPVSSQEAASRFFEASKEGDLVAVRFWLKQGVDVNASNQYGVTGLFYACERGHLDVARVLIAKGAKVNVKDAFYGYTPFFWAAARGHERLAGLLSHHGADKELHHQPLKPESSDEPVVEPRLVTAAEITELSREDERQPEIHDHSPHWAQFRGPFASGVSDGNHLPLSWDRSRERNVSWEMSIPGLAHSSPVVWGDRAFVTTAVSEEPAQLEVGESGDVRSADDLTEHEWKVYCLDKSSGSILWEQTAEQGIPSVKRHPKASHANPTPATDGEHLVVLFNTGGLYGYDMNGNLLWKQDLGKLDSGWFYDSSYQWGFASSPVMHDGTVIVQCDIQQGSFIAAFDAATGEQRWRTARDELPTWSTPTIVEHDGRTTIVTNGTKFARGYDFATGEELWRISGNAEISVPTPIAANGHVYVSSGYRAKKPIFAIQPDAEGDISLGTESNNRHVTWSVPRGGPYLSTPLAYGDYLYVCSDNGILSCYQAHTGELLYKERLRGGGARTFSASPVAADGRLYFTSEEGVVLVVKAGPEFEVLGRNDLGAPCFATPAISEGYLIFRTSQGVVAVRNQSPEPVLAVADPGHYRSGHVGG